MSDPFEPALLTVLYWFFVAVIIGTGAMTWQLARWTRNGPKRRAEF